MTLLIAMLWPALLGSVVLGALVGALTGFPSSRPTRAVALILAAIGAGLGGLAISGAVAGRPGFWIEVSALVLGTYLIGCLGGGGIARLRAKRAAGT